MMETYIGPWLKPPTTTFVEVCREWGATNFNDVIMAEAAEHGDINNVIKCREWGQRVLTCRWREQRIIVMKTS